MIYVLLFGEISTIAPFSNAYANSIESHKTAAYAEIMNDPSPVAGMLFSR